MSSSAPKRTLHFIGINHHRFHDPKLVEEAVRSTAQAIEVLVLDPSRDVRVVLFHDARGALPSQLLAEFRDLGIETKTVPSTSNGEGLNAQIELARKDGANFFYRVDADDTVAPDRFCLQANLLEQDRADVCGGGLTYVNVETSESFDVCPAETPGAIDYLTNCGMLHPTLAFQLDRFHEAGIAYWSRRLEDKQLGLQILRSGLRLYNDQAIYGRYNLVPAARKSFEIARLNFRLNTSYLLTSGRILYFPFALALFLASSLIPSHALRRLRQRLRRGAQTPVRPDAGFGGGSGAAKTAPPPPG